MAEICGIYKITNTITGDFYIGSSKNVKSRWTAHKCPSRWNRYSNNPMYQDMRKYGVDKFELQILEEVEPEHLKEAEQQFIETLKPTYNNRNANGWDTERRKEFQKEYRKTDKYKEYHKEYNKTDKHKEYQREHYQQNREKVREYHKEYNKEYYNQLCFYNGQTLTLSALSMRFKRKGIPHPTQEAKKYLLVK